MTQGKLQAIPRSRKDIRQVTRMLRKITCKEGDEDSKFCIINLLEKILPTMFGEFYYEIVEDTDLDCEAKTIPDEWKIILKQSVYEGACNENPRDRFTIAHEIGHLFLHKGINISLNRGNESIPAYKDPEWQANTFAAELLVPTFIRNLENMSVEDVSKTYGVSKKVAEIQLEHLRDSK